MPEPEELPVVEVPPGDQPALTVDTDKPNQPPAAATPATPPAATPTQATGESDAQYLQRLKSMENQLNGAKRINNDLRTRITALEQHIAQTPPRTTPPASTDELQALVDKGEWKTAVSRIAEEASVKAVENYKASQAAQAQLQQIDQTFNQSVQDAVAKYPQLDAEKGNPDDPFSQVYLEVTNSHPEWQRNPYGPLLALQRAEWLAQERGIAIKTPKPGTVQGKRRVDSSLPPSRPNVSGSHVVLTKDQLDMAKAHNIPPEDYARTIRELSEKGSVEVS